MTGTSLIGCFRIIQKEILPARLPGRLDFVDVVSEDFFSFHFGPVVEKKDAVELSFAVGFPPVKSVLRVSAQLCALVASVPSRYSLSLQNHIKCDLHHRRRRLSVLCLLRLFNTRR